MGWLWHAASLWGSGPGARGGMLAGAPGSFVLGWFQMQQLAPVVPGGEGHALSPHAPPSLPSPYLAGHWRLEPGLARLTSLTNFLLSGEVESVGDLWRHPSLRWLTLTERDPPFPMQPDEVVYMPALEFAALVGVGSYPASPPAPFYQLTGLTTLRLESGLPGDW